MRSIARRDLLRGGAAVATLAAIPFARKTAQGAPGEALSAPRNLIIVLNSGGWDTTYVLDPKPGATSIDGGPGSVTTVGGVTINAHPTRPKVNEFFTRYGARTAIVNGIQVQSFIHPDCTKRILTGAPSDTRPDVGAIAAFEHGRELPVPYLVLGGSAISGTLAAITGRAGTTNQVSALVIPEAAYPAPRTKIPSPGLVPTAKEDAFVRKYLEASAARVRATRGQRGGNARQVDELVKSLDRADALRTFAKGRAGFGKREYTPQLDVQVQVAVTALEGGLCHAAMLESGYWDTHEGNTRQAMLNEGLYGSLATLAGELEKRKLLDHTVVVVLSEMGRTPKLNAAAGKDHWPVTSALVFGAGVAGGRVLGATDQQLGARNVNLTTGAPDDKGSSLQTANLLAGVLALAGVDPSKHFPGVEPFHALRA